MRVYLAGPITGETYEAARYGWRAIAHDAFNRDGIQAYSPMRYKDRNEFSAKAQKSMSPMGGDGILSTPRGLTERDRWDTFNADLMFVNFLGAKKISAGTMIEFGWADTKRIPIVLCIEDEGNENDHAMVRAIASWRTSCFETGLKIARSVLLPGY